MISVPKRLRGVLTDRPQSMTPLPRIFREEIEQLLRDAAGVACSRTTAGQARPRLGAVSFKHRFGSAFNRHVHLHACVTNGVFERVAAADDVRFHAARPLAPADVATVTQWVRRRLVRWFCRKGFLSREAAADMLAWQHSGFSVDASVRISLADRAVPEYYQSLEHLLRHCAWPAFALERLSVVPDTGDRPERVSYALPCSDCLPHVDKRQPHLQRAAHGPAGSEWRRYEVNTPVVGRCRSRLVGEQHHLFDIVCRQFSTRPYAEAECDRSAFVVLVLAAAH